MNDDLKNPILHTKLACALSRSSLFHLCLYNARLFLPPSVSGTMLLLLNMLPFFLLMTSLTGAMGGSEGFSRIFSMISSRCSSIDIVCWGKWENVARGSDESMESQDDSDMFLSSGILLIPGKEILN